ERVFELEKRINAQATAIANLGTTVGMEKVRNPNVFIDRQYGRPPLCSVWPPFQSRHNNTIEKTTCLKT
ncbi:hypothetical protein F6S98_25870, partial [Escherichia coli]|nr:hypothetical protein [Escherichia coli]